MPPRGPQPKDPATLLRRNKATTAQVLDASEDDGKWPNLPAQYTQIQTWKVDHFEQKLIRVAYKKRTRDWYRMWQKSPQAQALLPSDREELARIAILVDRIYSGRDLSAAAFKAVETSVARFGATLQDRWRMKLSVTRGDVETGPPSGPGTVSSMERRRAERERLSKTAN